MNENKLTPSIRFKNNDGENYPEWDFVKVKEIASINTGNKDTKDAVENGQYDFYVRSPIVHKIDSFSYGGEAVLTVGDGVGVGKVFHYVNGKFDFHQRVYKISDFKDYYGLLFYYYFQKNFLKEAQKYNAKTSVDSVRKSMIADMYVPKIEMSEQIKIGNFFSKLDHQIELEEKKLELLEQQKRGYMQKIFSQELRFKDENGNEYPDWKDIKLNSIADIKTGNKNAQDSIENGKYMFFDRSVDIKYLNTFDFDEEAIIYPGEGSQFLPRYFKGKYSLHQRAYSIYNIKVDPQYLYNYLELQNNHFLKYAVGSTVKSLRMIAFNKLIISSPVMDEQEKIGSFFNKIDNLIELQTNKIESLKQRKKGLLQKMFI